MLQDLAGRNMRPIRYQRPQVHVYRSTCCVYVQMLCFAFDVSRNVIISIVFLSLSCFLLLPLSLQENLHRLPPGPHHAGPEGGGGEEPGLPAG